MLRLPFSEKGYKIWSRKKEVEMSSASYDGLHSDVGAAVEEAITSSRIVNVAAIAEMLRRRHAHLNVALEDIELLVLRCADHRRFPVEFDGSVALAD
ncbi:hypothetical protein QV13_01045 [Mesorhizobium hungaricum]|uniref:Uncharacterized protein n=2 Tax=Hyphomicrobiales TaxID=356 RepID=A0A1C2ECY3_9HYPH|nr:hypothetical protein QV13_01045 [Mesorhizobium hungaricum]